MGGVVGEVGTQAPGPTLFSSVSLISLWAMKVPCWPGGVC